MELAWLLGENNLQTKDSASANTLSSGKCQDSEEAENSVRRHTTQSAFQFQQTGLCCLILLQHEKQELMLLVNL
jgi:hypothetical protein